jgi:hypothetical protein
MKTSTITNPFRLEQVVAIEASGVRIGSDHRQQWPRTLSRRKARQPRAQIAGQATLRSGVCLPNRPDLDLGDAHGARAIVPAVSHEAVDVARSVVRDRGAAEVVLVIERHL